MAEWNHRLCEREWFERNTVPGEGGEVLIREPSRITQEGVHICCFCGRPTVAGIFVRHSPADPALVCGGSHD